MALSEADKKEVRAIAQEEAVNEAFAILELAEACDNYGDFRKGLRGVVEGSRGLDMDEAEINRLANEQSPPEESTKAKGKA